MRLFLLLPALSVLAASCSMKPSASSLSGCWTQPIPGQPGHTQGFMLKSDGKAASINMHTLLYTGWSLDGSQLTLTGKSIGNRTSSVFTTTSAIDRLSKTTLILNTDGNREAYTRTPCGVER